MPKWQSYSSNHIKFCNKQPRAALFVIRLFLIIAGMITLPIVAILMGSKYSFIYDTMELLSFISQHLTY
ncbi:hypothetical protein [Bacillus toyonensis]|uniref:Uncharacterized protein n=1 Tax=Bacillus toyonensis TaxID=155322 RepID=A0A2B5BC39_9BACI|nr:hypothetical protein [Bacillus toyonensis]MCU5728321.1 hypothetical protein [Bacillus toyonensis]MDD9264597.1 hypothetical protein [Bacillus toyonensis]PDZ82604.1 hypothetical protein CON93_25725 [Bacillus toyonensis]PEA69932.1 hypothetical protein COO00_24865 [Bacillus toyonensis]PEC38851.1 hypothetical protein CON60_14585 [Bacillus toyonensis]